MADQLTILTREQIAKFSTDQRTIRFFELLQGYVVESVPITLAELFLRVDQAFSIADDALAQSQQSLSKSEKQDQLLDIPINIPSEIPLSDVNNLQRFDESLPELIIPPTDTRKYDEITSSYGSRWIDSTSVSISTTEVDITSILGSGTQFDIGRSPFYYDSGANAFFVSEEFIDAFFFDVLMRISGTSPSPASQSQPITFILRRGDGTLITKFDYVVGRGLSGTFADQTIPIPTFVYSGGADPYQLIGFKISAIAANSGWTLTDKTLFLKR